MRKRTLVVGSLSILVPLFIWKMRARTSVSRSPLEVVQKVDLNRYMGRWYEIARLPNRFEKGCVATKATYTLRDDNTVDVLNE
jgi:apolipoprotein D and lipocalin family protein